MSNGKKILVVGAGLSGVSVSIQLIRKGAKVTLIHSGENHSSLVAAGILNPLVFRRMTKGWRVDEFIPYCINFYRSIERETNSSFFNHLPIRRLFSSEHERELWIKKQDRDDFIQYMTKIDYSDNDYQKSINQYGSGRIKNAFSVNPPVFLKSTFELISKTNTLINSKFNYSKLINTSYNDIKYDDIVFCEGFRGIDNPWFSFLPLNPTKGEVLTVKSQQLPEDESLNRKCFNLPLGEQRFKIGSTIDWNNTSLEITASGKAEILKNLSYIVDEDVEVLHHEAGIRPGSKDRRPFIGTHPDFPNYHVFNGLGSKGYLLAPLLSKEFSDWLLDGKPLDPEVRVERYFARS